MKYIPQYKISNLKIELEYEIKSLENQAQAEVTSVGFNNVQILIGEKERMLEKLTKLLK